MKNDVVVSDKKSINRKLLIIFLVFFLSACGQNITPESVVPSASPTQTPSPTLMPATVTPSPTEIPTATAKPTSTRIPLPTIVKRQPTPTVERPVEWDINPFFEKRIDTEWKGVRIKASFIIDSSLQDRIKSMEISDHFFADLVARTMFIAWYIRQNPGVSWARPNCVKNSEYCPVDVTPEEYYSFLDLWSQAQQSGEESDWRKVQINNIWANDLSDGNGYVQSPYNFWPMYEGPVPNDVTAMIRFTLVLTDFFSTSSIVKLTSAELDAGYGFNFDNGDMMFYAGSPVKSAIVLARCKAHYLSVQNCLKGSILVNFMNIGHELTLNQGRSFIDYHTSADYYISLKIGKYIDFEFIVD